MILVIPNYLDVNKLRVVRCNFTNEELIYENEEQAIQSTGKSDQSLDIRIINNNLLIASDTDKVSIYEIQILHNPNSLDPFISVLHTSDTKVESNSQDTEKENSEILDLSLVKLHTIWRGDQRLKISTSEDIREVYNGTICLTYGKDVEFIDVSSKKTLITIDTFNFEQEVKRVSFVYNTIYAMIEVNKQVLLYQTASDGQRKSMVILEDDFREWYLSPDASYVLFTRGYRTYKVKYTGIVDERCVLRL